MNKNDIHTKLKELKKLIATSGIDAGAEFDKLEEKLKTASGAEAVWKHVELARHPMRPYAMDYIVRIFTDWTELHGDRCYGDDPAILGGLAFFEGRPVTILAHQKGRTLKENVYRNYGMANPEGYRKALRLAKQAEKFGRPVITFVDTAGAYP
ncbi:MAG: acetyl-CoA carboxylase carboxyl transferase subunit alpha, partial [Spirochaetaceae bacterium]|nr:acetyl-CoA carboxylase carboxyl transferase subunit alpha [Spirochaetaceae bacterium]